MLHRVAIESTNAETRNHRADINRGYTRVFGLTGTSLLLVFGMAGLNVRILHDWHEARGLPDHPSDQGVSLPSEGLRTPKVPARSL